LERIRQALELLAYRHKNEVDNSEKRHGSHSQAVKASLDEILDELKSLQYKTYAISGTSSPVSTSFNSNIHDKLVKQNQELSDTIKKLTQEKTMLKSSLAKLEDELIHFRKTVSKTANTDHSNSSLTDHDKEKFKKLYYKFLRAESFRKSLVYQKRFLLIMLSGYEDTEREILATLRLDPRLSSLLKTNIPPAIMTLSNNADYTMNLSKNSSFYSNKYITNKAKSHFKTGAICIIAIHRIK
jgi:pericentrin